MAYYFIIVLLWLVEYGIWTPQDGDPLAILKYSDAFDGNEEYENSKLDRHDMHAPGIPECA